MIMKFMLSEIESATFSKDGFEVSLNRSGMLRAVKAMASGKQAESILAEKGITLNSCEKDWLYGV